MLKGWYGMFSFARKMSASLMTRIASFLILIALLPSYSPASADDYIPRNGIRFCDGMCDVTLDGNSISLHHLWERGRISVEGANVDSTTNVRTKVPYRFDPNKTYVIDRSAGTVLYAYCYDAAGTFKSYRQVHSPYFTTNEGEEFVRFVYRYESASTITEDFGSTFLIAETEAFNKPLLTIIDDDGYARYYSDIFPIAKEKKASISTAVIVGDVGKPGRMTWDNIEDVYQNGMEVLSHSFTHALSTDADYSTKTVEDFAFDYRKAKNILKQHGIDSNLLVFTGSSGRDERCREACKLTSYDGGFLAGTNAINYGGEDRFAIQRYRIGNNTDYHYDLTTLKGLIDTLKTQKGWMIWMVHSSGDSNAWVAGTGEGSSAYMLGQIIDYARDNGVDVVTAEYGFRKYFENK